MKMKMRVELDFQDGSVNIANNWHPDGFIELEITKFSDEDYKNLYLNKDNIDEFITALQSIKSLMH